MGKYQIPVFQALGKWTPGSLDEQTQDISAADVEGIGQLFQQGWLAKEIAQEYDHLRYDQIWKARRLYRERMKSIQSKGKRK